jgi:hypothetical protein
LYRAIALSKVALFSILPALSIHRFGNLTDKKELYQSAVLAFSFSSKSKFYRPITHTI